MKIRKSTLGLTGLLLVMGLCTSPAHADPAVVINFDEGLCFAAEVVDGELNFLSADSGQLTITNDHNGRLIVKCKAKNFSNSTGRAVVFNFGTTGGASCLWLMDGLLYATQSWQETLSASGNMTLTCRIDNDDLIGPI